MSEKLTLEEKNLAENIYIALIGNPERKALIAANLGKNGNSYTPEEANKVNLDKAIELAKYFYANPDLTK